MDDAIDLADALRDVEEIETTVRRVENPAAAFIFAGPAEAQYLANSVDAALSCVNSIPNELLLGPRVAIPVYGSADVSVSPRYSRRAFEETRLILSNTSPTSHPLDAGFLTVATGSDNALRDWTKTAVSPLRATGQKEGRKVDFFLQAIMTGATVTLLPLVVGLVYLCKLTISRWS